MPSTILPLTLPVFDGVVAKAVTPTANVVMLRISMTRLWHFLKQGCCIRGGLILWKSRMILTTKINATRHCPARLSLFVFYHHFNVWHWLPQDKLESKAISPNLKTSLARFRRASIAGRHPAGVDESKSFTIESCPDSVTPFSVCERGSSIVGRLGKKRKKILLPERNDWWQSHRAALAKYITAAQFFGSVEKLLFLLVDLVWLGIFHP